MALKFKLFNPTWAVTCSLLPAQMDSKAAKAMLIAIALQESRFEHRRQIRGPARGYWQFEQNGGVKGVLAHRSTKEHIRSVLDVLGYDDLIETSYTAIEHNDVLALAYARLLLWTLPDPLPSEGEVDEAWGQYLKAWRPGKPHPQSWDALYRGAWDLVNEGGDK